MYKQFYISFKTILNKKIFGFEDKAYIVMN